MAAYVHFNCVIDLKINSQTNPPNRASISCYESGCPVTIFFIDSVIKDVRSKGFCASLLRTEFIAQYHATSCIERAR